MTPTLWRRAVAALAVVPLLALPLFLRAADDDEKPLGKLPADLALVPRDAFFFTTVRVGDLFADAAMRKLLPLLPGALGDVPRGPRADLVKDFETSFGLAVPDLERVTFVVRRVMSGPPAVILRAKKAIDRDTYLKRFDRTDESTFHGKKVIVVAPGRGRFGPPMAIHFADDRTVVQGMTETVVPLLGALAAGGKTHPLADELKEAAGTHTVVLAGRPSFAYRVMDAERRQWERDVPMKFKDRIDKDKKTIERPPSPKGLPPADKAVPKDVPVLDKGEVAMRLAQREKDVVKDGGRPDLDPDRMKEPPLKLRTMKEIDEDDRDPRFRSEAEVLLKPVFRATRAILTVDGGETITADARAEFESDDDAKDGETLARMGLYLMREMLPEALRRGPMGIDFKAKPVAELQRQYKAALRGVETRRFGAKVLATGKAKLDLTPLLKYMANELPAQTDANNLKQIGLAFHMVQDTHGYFSRAVCDKDGKPLLSWRVHILPYIEEDVLYRQFKLDEPWDSPHNKKLLARMPRIYRGVGTSAEPDATTTKYQVVSGPNTLFPKPDTKVAVHRIPDGSSNTFLVVEAGKAVPWTKPEDIELDATTFPKLGGQFERFFHAVLCDGSVRRVGRKAPEKTLRLAIDPSDGNIFSFDDLKP